MCPINLENVKTKSKLVSKFIESLNKISRESLSKALTRERFDYFSYAYNHHLQIGISSSLQYNSSKNNVVNHNTFENPFRTDLIQEGKNHQII